MLLRTLLTTVMLTCGAACVAQDYPARPITLVVPTAPGGALDLAARAIAQELGKQMKQSVVVDNKPGGSGVLAVQTVARAAPDGYTLLMTHSVPLISTPYLLQKVPYAVRKDLAFISEIGVGRTALAVSANVPVKDVQGLLDLAARSGNQVSFGSNGIGTFSHMVGAYFNQSRDLKMVHVPYKSEGQMVQDLASGQLAWGIATIGTLAPFTASGKVRILAVLGDRRAKSLPTTPTMSEAGFSDSLLKSYFAWVGVLAPANTPAPIVARLEKEFRQAVFSHSVKARFDTFDTEAVGSTADEFRRVFESTEPVMKRMIEESGAKLE